MKKLSFILFLFLFSISVVGQPTRLKVDKRIRITDGLSNNSVTSLLEDSRGYLWVGTFNGLNRYDGLRTKVYKNSYGKQILESSRVRSLMEDKNGMIWVGTESGLSIYNYEKEEFRCLYSNRLVNGSGIGPGIIKIIEFDGGVYALTARGGLYVFDYNYLLQAIIHPSVDEIPVEAFFYDVTLLDDSHLLFSTKQGLVLYNSNNRKYSLYRDEWVHEVTSTLVLDEKFLLLTLDKGVVVLNYSLDDGFNYTVKSKSFANFHFYTSALDSSGGVWLGDFNRSLRYVTDVYDLVEKQPYESSYFSIKNQSFSTRSIWPTADNGCWVGTFNKGLYKFNTEASPFVFVKEQLNKDNKLSQDKGLKSCVVDSTSFYVVNKSGQIIRYNTDSNTNALVEFVDQRFKTLKVENVFVDSKKKVWVKFLNRPSIVRFSSSLHYMDEIAHPYIAKIDNLREFEEDVDGNIWLNGLDLILKINLDKDGQFINCFNFNDHPFFNQIDFPLVKDMYLDIQYPFLWLGTIHAGLFRVDISNPDLAKWKVDNYTLDYNNPYSISSGQVSAICRSSSHDLFVGTIGGGICKVLHSDSVPQFLPYTTEQGLSNNDIQSLVCDDQGGVWLGTNYGLNYFDPTSENFAKYYSDDALPFEEFSNMDLYLDNGRIIFNNINGFIYFDKDDLSRHRTLPKLIFEDFKVFNDIINPGDTLRNRILLTKHVDHNEEIVLKHNENTFSLEAISLHYSDPDNFYIRHQLLPNKKWIKETSAHHTLKYSSLRPGKYKLNVMVSNSSGKWSEAKQLSIIVRPPLWRSMPFYALYLILFVLIVNFIYRSRIRYMNLHHKLEIEQLEGEKGKAISQAKLDYFSNISHEIKTPITLIDVPTKQLAEQFKHNKGVYEKVNMIMRQTRKIVTLINQVNDLQKSDADLLKLENSYFYFNELVEDVTADFKHLANESDKVFEIIAPIEAVYVFADKDKLAKVFNNLLSNAFKFTHKNDVIKVSYEIIDKTVKVKVSDSGRGISAEDLPHIFELFYHNTSELNEGGSGIGLAFSKRLVEMHSGIITVESVENDGSVFEISLPIVAEEPEVLIKQKENIILQEGREVKPLEIDKSKKRGNFDLNEKVKGLHVYFAEDNMELSKYVAESLGEFFKVTTFYDGKSCLKSLENEWPDFILSDVMMPEMNGLELCKAIKTDMKTSHIPVVLLTASSTIEDQVQGLKDGADAYITKPFEMRVLMSQIESIMLGRQQLRERFNLKMPLSFVKDEMQSSDIVFLEKLNQMINDNLSNSEFDVTLISKDLFLNRTHFFQKVKALTNRTPYDLLKTYRIEKAAELLLQDKLSVNEAFWATGFKSKPHFNRVFKERFDMTPREYINKVTES